MRSILAEFGPVPNAHSDVSPLPAAAAAAAPEGVPRTGPAGESAAPQPKRSEVGGPGSPEPTRFGDWERNGRCIDF